MIDRISTQTVASSRRLQLSCVGGIGSDGNRGEYAQGEETREEHDGWWTCTVK